MAEFAPMITGTVAPRGASRSTRLLGEIFVRWAGCGAVVFAAWAGLPSLAGRSRKLRRQRAQYRFLRDLKLYGTVSLYSVASRFVA